MMSQVTTADAVRTTPLTSAELATYRERGFVVPGRLLSEEQVDLICAALQEHLDGRFEGTVSYDFADPSLDTTQGVRMKTAIAAQEAAKKREKAERTMPLLMNLWEIDDRFRNVATNPVAAGWAAQLLEADEVLLFEDTAFVKPARRGGRLVWHQDYSFFPTASADVVGCWIALDDVDADNGTINYAVGSHKRGEVLPVEFKDGKPYMHDKRPGVPEMGDPLGLGMQIENLVLKRGECAYHDSLIWHTSGLNDSDRPRRALGVRYIKAGTLWLGEQRYAWRPDSEMHFPVPGPIVPGGRFPHVERAF
jgi:ectoine hydroxylase-related dioxygenase (phytanoyl-CoA dioxygenase family)